MHFPPTYRPRVPSPIHKEKKKPGYTPNINAVAMMVCQNFFFLRFPSLFLCKIGCARAKPKYDPKEIILTLYIKRH